jgi:small-conductance mechanosensitive channel
MASTADSSRPSRDSGRHAPAGGDTGGARPDQSPHGPDAVTASLLKRAWRWLLPLLAGLAAAVLAATRGNIRAPQFTQKLTALGGALGFLLLAMAATLTLANQIRQLTRPRLSAAHAGLLRLTIVFGGGVASLLVTLGLLSIPIGQLILGGALTGVVFGIAGQQTLANMFAGMVLLIAHPFRVGERVQLRSGALGGTIEGLVVEIGLAYLHVDAPEGLLAIPNSQALSAVVAPPTPPAPSAAPD